MVGQPALQNRRSCRKHRHYRGPGQEHIVEKSRMVDVLGLVGDLEAGAAHPEVHAVHVDLAGEGLRLTALLHVRVLVLEEGHFNFDLLFAATLVDGLGQAEKSRVWACRFFRDKFLMRMDVPAFDTALV